MPRYNTPQRYQVGEWWIGRKPGSPAWHRCRYNTETQQTERISLRTVDYAEAKQRLDQWFIESHRPQSEPLTEISLAAVVGRYLSEHAAHTPSAKTALIHASIWLDYWQDAALSELTPPKQREFHAALKSQGKSESYIQRSIATIQAAVNFAWKNGEIAAPVYFLKLPKQSGKPMGRPIERAELRALLAASPAEHLQRYIKTLMATAARPDAVLDLNSRQIDFQRGLINLNPAGRQQTKKYRPTVRLPARYADDIQRD